MSSITGRLVQDMVTDWLHTPVNGYLGSSYGQDIKRILHRPLTTPMIDNQINKLRADVAVLNVLPAGAVNIYSKHDERQKLSLYIEVAGRLLPIDSDLRKAVDNARTTQPAVAVAGASPPSAQPTQTRGLPFQGAVTGSPLNVALQNPESGDLLQYDENHYWANVPGETLLNGGEF